MPSQYERRLDRDKRRLGGIDIGVILGLVVALSLVAAGTTGLALGAPVLGAVLVGAGVVLAVVIALRRGLSLSDIPWPWV